MQSTRRSKPVRRTSRTRTVVAPLSAIQTRRLENLFEESSGVKSTNLNLSSNTAYVSDVINVKSLLNIRSIQPQNQRDKTTSLLDDRIIVNICGDRYETHRTTLELYPDTLLGNQKRRKYYYDNKRKEYFFDRHRECFGAILYYYQSHGRLRRPNYVPLDIFLEEVTFFQLGQQALNQIRKDENVKEVKKIRLPKNHIRRYLWATMEYPAYSLTAKIVNIISLLMVLVSTIGLAAESLPQYVAFDDLDCQQEQSTTVIMSYLNNITNSSSSQTVYDCQWYFTSPFFIIQAITVGFFTLELLARILTTPSLLDFIKNLMNWIDLLAVIPFYVTLGIRLSDGQNDINTNAYVSLRFLRILRLARVLKFFRVFKNVKSLRALRTTIRESLLDFLIMILILTLVGFLFGAAAYYAENSSNGDAFDSIFKATYWGIITVTSVGYGDIVPITPTGRVISCLCALSGAATIGMLVSVLVDRYQRVYLRKLYIQEEQIDFDDYSDDENNDTESKDVNDLTENRRISNIEDPDARAKENALHEQNTLELPQTPDSQLEEGSSTQQTNNRIHFIVGYVDNDKHEISRDLLDKISSVVGNKQTSEDNILLNVISNENTQDSSPFDVHFNIESSDDDDDDLTEITKDHSNGGNVLKTFKRPVSPTDGQLNNSETNV